MLKFILDTLCISAVTYTEFGHDFQKNALPENNRI